MHDPCERNLGPLLGCAHHLIVQYLDRQLRAFDMTPAQVHTLLFILREEPKREVNQRDLEDFLRVRPSTVNGIVERLEQKGLLTRVPSQSDGRRRALHLTDRGRSFESEFSRIAETSEKQISAIFAPEEEAQLHLLLRRLISYLQSEEANV